MLVIDQQFLKAAGFTAAMMFAEYCIRSHSDQNDHHHHHHHHEHQGYLDAFVGNVLSVTAMAFINATRFGISRVSDNNAVAMGVSELAISYLSPSGNILTAAFRGLFGAGVATAVNALVPDEKTQSSPTLRKPT